MTAPDPAELEVSVVADRLRLRQVLLNLLANAVKYNSEGGSVVVEVEALAADQARILVRDTGPDYGYRILIEESQQEIVEKLNELKAAIEAGDLKPWEFRGITAIWFGRHLYQPLLYLQEKIVEISPVPLNKGERQFVDDLKAFHDNDGGFFGGKELYLLRNLSKGRGVGFFEAGNFHPDFIVWQLAAARQRVAFVDPKGIRNVGLQDPKIGFFETVKDIEKRLGDPDVVLDSFIVSNTPSHVMRKQWGIGKADMVKRHIVFQDEDKDTYIGAVLRGGLGASA